MPISYSLITALVINLLMNMGTFYINCKDGKSAETYFQKALSVLPNQDHTNQSIAMSYLGGAYYLQGQMDDAIHFLKLAFFEEFLPLILLPV